MVISRVDHKNLNLDVDFMEVEICAGCENRVMEFWKILEPSCEGDQLNLEGFTN